MFNKKKFKLILIRKEFQTLNVIKVVTTNTLGSTAKILDKTYPIIIQYPTYLDGLQKVYMLDFDSGSQLKFSEIEALLKPEELDLIISTNVIKDLTAGALDKKEKIMVGIMGFIIGVLSGVAGMMFYMQSEINRIYESLGITVIVPTP